MNGLLGPNTFTRDCLVYAIHALLVIVIHARYAHGETEFIGKIIFVLTTPVYILFHETRIISYFLAHKELDTFSPGFGVRVQRVGTMRFFQSRTDFINLVADRTRG